MPYPDNTKIQSPMARARGAGSAKSGTHHWWLVKVTSVALVPLTLWFFFGLLCIVMRGGTYETTLEWVQKPYNAFLLCVFLGTNFYHAALGGQEVIIDYVHKHHVQLPALVLYKLFCFFCGALGIFTVLYITFKL
jgi:succinate dehydrogenase / fumarate reductase membrane anchor subunit